MNAAQPGPLVSAEWLAEHLGDADLRIVHVSTDRKAYDQGHVPGAIFVDLHVDLAKPGTRPETGAVKRLYLVPTREEVGKEFNVTRERIRQIEAKALRKLRHPSRSEKLRSFLEGEG